MSDAVMEFYKVARRDDEMVSLLAGIEDEALFIKTAMELGREKGFVFTAEEAGAAISQFDGFIEDVSNDDELTDFELEMVAAGLPINCSSGAVRMQ
ncbi:hypothetical protein GH722_19505 [Alphaproteobacteria bacterium HT1-32]|nr:hypothetical protein [Alphaproteobacteria bacterium HT1-32]